MTYFIPKYPHCDFIVYLILYFHKPFQPSPKIIRFWMYFEKKLIQFSSIFKQSRAEFCRTITVKIREIIDRGYANANKCKSNAKKIEKTFFLGKEHFIKK